MFVIINASNNKLFSGWVEAVSGESKPNWSTNMIQTFHNIQAARIAQKMIQKCSSAEDSAKIVVRRIRMDFP